MILVKDTMMVNDDDEEDASITSTIPVTTKEGQCCTILVDLDIDGNDDEASLSSCESNSNKTPRRVVHFDESQNKSYTYTATMDTQCRGDKMREYNKNDLWYNSLDYQQFKMTTMHIANKIAHADEHNDSFARTYYKVLQRTYQACCCQASAVSSGNEDMNDISINSIFACSTEQAFVQQWMHAASSSGALLGVVEKHSIYEIVLDRSHRRMELISAVLEIQDFCTLHKHATDRDGQAAVAEMMRLASCEWSRPSRIFAQVLAKSVL